MLETQPIQQKRLAVLEDTCQYFNLSKRNVIGRRCLYYPVNESTEGCAVGRLIKDKDLCSTLDNKVGTTVDIIFILLPKELQELGKQFLVDLQNLHDDKDCWTETGLSEEGFYQKRFIVDKHCS